MHITILGTLPPVKGITDACLNQLRVMQEKAAITYIDFRSIYPEFLYPGGTKDYSRDYRLPRYPSVTVRKIISWYNPFSWILAGLSVRGSLFHFHWWTSFLFPVIFPILIIVRLKKIPSVAEVHNVVGHETGFLDRWMNGIIFRLTDRFVVHAGQNKEQLMRRFGIGEKRITIIPMGSLTHYKDRPVSKGDARKRLGFSGNMPVVLYFGYIRKYKGIDVLIRAFTVVRKRIPDAILVIAGICWIDWTPYRELIKKLHLEDAVRCDLRYIPNTDVKYYFSACDLTVFPYLDYDAQCGPGRIALAFGKPLVVSNTGGLPELVRSKMAIVPPGEVDVLSTAMIRILRNTRLRQRLEKESQIVAKELSWERHGEMLLKLYGTLERIME